MGDLDLNLAVRVKFHIIAPRTSVCGRVDPLFEETIKETVAPSSHDMDTQVRGHTCKVTVRVQPGGIRGPGDLAGLRAIA